MMRLAMILQVGLAIGLPVVPLAAQDAAQEKPKIGPEEMKERLTPIREVEPPDSAPQAPSGPPLYGREAMVNRRLPALERFREQLLDKIKLDPGKRKTIHEIFESYMAGLLNPDIRPHMQPKPEDLAVPQQLPELEKQLKAAQEALDRGAVESIKPKIASAKIALEPCVIDPVTFFLAHVNAELDENQQNEFKALAERWQLLRANEITPDDQLKQLRRASRDPALKAPEAQREKIDEVMVEALRSVPFPERRERARMNEAAAKFKPKLLELLDPAQREHLEKTLVMLRKWEEEDAEWVPKIRERLKSRVPVHDASARPAGAASPAVQD